MTLGPDVALLCHWDPSGAVRPDTARYIRELAEAGFSVVVISNGTPIRPEVAASLTGAALCLTRWNVGIDFGAWRMAMHKLSLPRANTKRILLVNDSVYGPLVPLAPLLARMAPDGQHGARPASAILFSACSRTGRSQPRLAIVLALGPAFAMQTMDGRTLRDRVVAAHPPSGLSYRRLISIRNDLAGWFDPEPHLGGLARAAGGWVSVP